jgi:hypothetical protein
MIAISCLDELCIKPFFKEIMDSTASHGRKRVGDLREMYGPCVCGRPSISTSSANKALPDVGKMTEPVYLAVPCCMDAQCDKTFEKVF